MTFSQLPLRGLKLSFAKWLMLVSLLAMLPMLGFSVIVVQRLLKANQDQEVATLERRTGLAAETIGREIDRVRTVAHVLSLSDVAVRGDFEGMHALASRVAAADPPIQLIALVQRDDRRIFSTTRRWGEVGMTRPLPASEVRAVDDNVVVMSPILPIGRAGELMVGVIQPLQLDGGGRYSLRLAIRQTAFSAALASMRFPLDWTAAVIDQNMNIVARSRDEARFVGQPATEGLQDRLRVGNTASFGTVNKEGARTLAALARVPGSDWWVVVGLPEAGLNARAREPLLWVISIGLLLVALGVAGAALLGRELTRQVLRAAYGQAQGDLSVRELRHFESRTRRATDALHDARHDTLTGLPLRALFTEQAERLNADARVHAHWGLAALFIDLDGFKQVNDRMGHDAGDRILVEVGAALRRDTRAGDCCGRLGGDEFVVALTPPLDQLQHISEGVAARIVRDVASLGDGLGCSIGVATAPAGTDLKTLLDRADKAMLSAKGAGKNRVEIAPDLVV